MSPTSANGIICKDRPRVLDITVDEFVEAYNKKQGLSENGIITAIKIENRLLEPPFVKSLSEVECWGSFLTPIYELTPTQPTSFMG